MKFSSSNHVYNWVQGGQMGYSTPWEELQGVVKNWVTQKLASPVRGIYFPKKSYSSPLPPLQKDIFPPSRYCRVVTLTVYSMYGMYGTISATVRYSTVYGTVHRKWSEMYSYTVFSVNDDLKP